MTFRSDLEDAVAKIFREQWSTREGSAVPDDEGVKLGNDGVYLDAVVLYADMADSTDLVHDETAEFAAEIYKAYLYCAGRIIKSMGGEITAYDGDRVMAVYVGGSKNTAAAQTALRINRAVEELVQPAMKKIYSWKEFKLRQKVGVDSSQILVAKTGVRGSNDLVWVGDAANNAAKLAALSTEYASYISADVYSQLGPNAKFKNGDSTGENMWTSLGYRSDVGFRVYGSNWMQWF